MWELKQIAVKFFLFYSKSSLCDKLLDKMLKTKWIIFVFYLQNVKTLNKILKASKCLTLYTQALGNDWFHYSCRCSAVNINRTTAYWILFYWKRAMSIKYGICPIISFYNLFRCIKSSMLISLFQIFPSQCSINQKLYVSTYLQYDTNKL